MYTIETLQFFPNDTEYFGEVKYDYDYDEEDKNEREDDYNPWDNYSCEESLYDALGGEMGAIWNID